MSSVTNLTTALGLPNFVSTVSGSISQDLPGLMFLSTGSVTNRAQIENITTSIFPFAVQPGFSLANLFDGSLPVGGIFTNPVSVAQQPFIPGLLSVTNQAGLPNTGVLPNFPIFQPGAFQQGGNTNLQFPPGGNILLGGLLSNGIPQAGGMAGATLGGTGLNVGGALGGGLQQGGSLIPAGAVQSGGGVLTPGNNGLGQGGLGAGGLGSGALNGQQLAALLNSGQLSSPQLSALLNTGGGGMAGFPQQQQGFNPGLMGMLGNQSMGGFGGMGTQVNPFALQQSGIGNFGGLGNGQLQGSFGAFGNNTGLSSGGSFSNDQLNMLFNSQFGGQQQGMMNNGFALQNNGMALAPSPFPFQSQSFIPTMQQQAFSPFQQQQAFSPFQQQQAFSPFQQQQAFSPFQQQGMGGFGGMMMTPNGMFFG